MGDIACARASPSFGPGKRVGAHSGHEATSINRISALSVAVRGNTEKLHIETPIARTQERVRPRRATRPHTIWGTMTGLCEDYGQLGGPQLGGNTTARVRGNGRGLSTIRSQPECSRLSPVTGGALGPATLPATAAHAAHVPSPSGPMCRCDAAIDTRTAKQSAVNAATKRRAVQCLDVIANTRNCSIKATLRRYLRVATSHRYVAACCEFEGTRLTTVLVAGTAKTWLSDLNHRDATSRALPTGGFHLGFPI